MLRRHGVTRATWHADGALASVEFGPAVDEVKAQRRRQIEKEPEPPKRSDLSVLDDLPAFEGDA